MKNLLLRIFTWWNGATVGTGLFTALNGVRAGEDAEGNIYYRSKRGDRRWVIYKGEAEASRVPAEWHGWLHKTVDETPVERPSAANAWEGKHTMNMTGTPDAYVPSGSLARGGVRQRACADYEAWRPE